jgi:hypothetical protein
MLCPGGPVAHNGLANASSTLPITAQYDCSGHVAAELAALLAGEMIEP